MDIKNLRNAPVRTQLFASKVRPNGDKMEEKICKKCQQKLATTCFYKKKSGLLGRDSICKTCISKQKKSRYQSQQNLNKKSFSQTTSRQNNPQIKLHTVFVDTDSKQARDALALLLSSIDKYTFTYTQGGQYH